MLQIHLYNDIYILAEKTSLPGYNNVPIGRGMAKYDPAHVQSFVLSTIFDVFASYAQKR